MRVLHMENIEKLKQYTSHVLGHYDTQLEKLHHEYAQLKPSFGATREYHYVALEKTWPEAQRYCRENFVDLATIETEEDGAIVKKFPESSGGFAWIGLYDDINGWKWSNLSFVIVFCTPTFGFLEQLFYKEWFCASPSPFPVAFSGSSE
uniref:C-type lectin domain-containing protein n=1 Tax=Amphilophus citrinellus TaxID=61819 RepID=A0A3Q0R961_AMPCI